MNMTTGPNIVTHISLSDLRVLFAQADTDTCLSADGVVRVIEAEHHEVYVFVLKQVTDGHQIKAYKVAVKEGTVYVDKESQYLAMKLLAGNGINFQYNSQAQRPFMVTAAVKRVLKEEQAKRQAVYA